MTRSLSSAEPTAGRPTDAVRETVSDYSEFDFARLWAGRERVTEVERSILASCLAGGDPRRLLEVGTGFGRLLPCLTAVGDDVVALDFDARSLARTRRAARGKVPYLWVAANLYHLPFRDGAFTGTVMVRVYHHLDNPAAALGELARVLQVGGRAVVSYSPKPSWGTMVIDVQHALRSSKEAPFRSTTFSRAPAVEVSSGNEFPTVVSSRERFAATAHAAGFRVESEEGTGFEEFRPLRRFPSDYFRRWSQSVGRAPGFPVRFARLVVERPRPSPWTARERILACPRCRTGLDAPVEGRGLLCPACSYAGSWSDGVIDLRFVPEGARRVVVRSADIAPPRA